MAIKQYDTQRAIDPGQGKSEQQDQDDINYSEFVSGLPEEFQEEIELALAGMLAYLHSEEGTTTILEAINNVKGDIPAEIGKQALMAMDAADPDHKWSDSAKVFCGYFAVKEVATIARAAGIVDIPEEQEGEIFKQAAQNYIHFLIKSKPTREERDAEAIRIQKEVEPLMPGDMRKAGYAVAKDKGIPHEEMAEPAPKEGQQTPPSSPVSKQGGLLE